jgi:hypothetical protein
MNHPEPTTTRNHWLYAIETANTGAYRRVTIGLPTPMRAVPTITVDINGNYGSSGVDGGAWTSYNSVSLYVNSINSSSDYAYADDLVATAEL